MLCLLLRRNVRFGSNFQVRAFELPCALLYTSCQHRQEKWSVHSALLTLSRRRLLHQLLPSGIFGFDSYRMSLSSRAPLWRFYTSCLPSSQFLSVRTFDEKPLRLCLPGTRSSLVLCL